MEALRPFLAQQDVPHDHFRRKTGNAKLVQVQGGEVQEISSILITTHALLADITSGPSLAVPSGLWEPLAAALDELGDPTLVVVVDARHRVLAGPDGFPVLAPASTGTAEVAPALEKAIRRLVELGRGGAAHPDFSVQMTEHGLTGRQLRAKKALVDHGYADYVAGGRLPEIPRDNAGWMRRQGRALMRALAPCATTLDSLSSVPGLGALGLVSEAVSAAEHALDFGTR